MQAGYVPTCQKADRRVGASPGGGEADLGPVRESGGGPVRQPFVRFSLPPHIGDREAKLHLLCPVRALAYYVERTAAIRRTEQPPTPWT